MIIEISSCGGEYSFKIQDHFISGVNNDVTLNYYEKKENGKHTIYIKNLKSNIYYLSIEANEDDFICKMKNQGKTNINCGNDLSYIMYYYTEYEQGITVPKVDKLLNYMPYGNGKIKIEIPKIIFRDINYKEREISDFKFDVFATRKKEYFDKLGNVCFLSRFVPSEETVFYLEEKKLSKKKSLIISGLGYRNQYYIGVLMQNAKTRELIAFNPIVIWSGGLLPYPIWEIVITFLIILICFIISYCPWVMLSSSRPVYVQWLPPSKLFRLLFADKHHRITHGGLLGLCILVLTSGSRISHTYLSVLDLAGVMIRNTSTIASLPVSSL